MMIDGLGFARSREECLANPAPIVHTMERIFTESITLVAAGLGVELDEVTTVYDVAVADQGADGPHGHHPGRRRRWDAVGVVGDEGR